MVPRLLGAPLYGERGKERGSPCSLHGAEREAAFLALFSLWLKNILHGKSPGAEPSRLSTGPKLYLPSQIAGLCRDWAWGCASGAGDVTEKAERMTENTGSYQHSPIDQLDKKKLILI